MMPHEQMKGVWAWMAGKGRFQYRYDEAPLLPGEHLVVERSVLGPFPRWVCLCHCMAVMEMVVKRYH